MAQMRYLVNDVAASIDFYTQGLGFALKQQFGPAMAIVTYDDLELWLAGPKSSAAQPMPNGDRPEAGGWNRCVLRVDDIEALHATLLAQGIAFRNNIIQGPGGRQVLCEDPSGNAIELFQAE